MVSRTAIFHNNDGGQIYFSSVTGLTQERGFVGAIVFYKLGALGYPIP